MISLVTIQLGLGAAAPSLNRVDIGGTADDFEGLPFFALTRATPRHPERR